MWFIYAVALTCRLYLSLKWLSLLPVKYYALEKIDVQMLSESYNKLGFDLFLFLLQAYFNE